MIYRIDEQIQLALESMVDPETGELVEGYTEEDVITEIENLQKDFDSLVDNITSDYKNLDAEVEAITAEIQNLQERKRRCVNRRDRDKRFLAYLLNGQKWKNGRHSISFRKSERVVVDAEFLTWAETYAPGLLAYKDPEPRKTDIARAIKSGTVVEHAHIEETNNIVIQKLKKKEEV